MCVGLRNLPAVVREYSPVLTKIGRKRGPFCTVRALLDNVNRNFVLDRDGLEGVIQALRRREFALVGPTVRDGAIVVDHITSLDDLPSGWSDEQESGSYRLARRSDGALFAHAAPALPWKHFAQPATEQLFAAERTPEGIRFVGTEAHARKKAFVGIAPCDLAALDLLGRPEGLFAIAVRCSKPAPTCFCGSFSAIHQLDHRCDLALTEILEGEHRFFVEIFSEAGVEILNDVKSRTPTPSDTKAVAAVHEQGRQAAHRSVDIDGLSDALSDAFEHPKWASVSSKCLACGNCTMVCPTCFCNTVEDGSALDGKRAWRTRRWDSCFSLKFSYIHGGSVRASAASRFRQRVLHKFLWSREKYGAPGCVGCGRCIAWCPAAIDITQEVKGFQKAAVNR